MQENTEYNLPEGCEIVEGTNICIVPFSLMSLPDDVEYEGKGFTNPRNITEASAASHIDAKCAKDLRDSIINHGLLTPLAVRFVTDKYGKPKFMVIGGERRFRTISKLIDDNTPVSTGKDLVVHPDGELCSIQKNAKIVFNKVPCQVYFCRSDQEAYAISWAENKNRQPLTDGVEVAEVQSFRRKGYNDLFITGTLQREYNWLQITDKLLKNLDEDTLSDLLNDRIARDAAIKLLNIENVNDRKSIINKASEHVQVKKGQEALDIVKKELQMARDEEFEAESEEERKPIREKIEKLETAADIVKKEPSPPITAKDINKAVRETKRSEPRRDDKKVKSLKDKQVNQFVQYLEKLIRDKGVDQSKNFVIDVTYLEFALRLFRDNHLAGNKFFIQTMIEFVGWLEEHESVV
jgi:ParB-like chromosome segregation protein Spo0J